jgi:hypothetical protein
MARSKLSIALLTCAPALLLSSCSEKSAGPPAPAGGPTSSVASTPVASTPPAKPPPSDTGDVWLSVRRGDVELGIIELRLGKRGVLTLEGDNEHTQKLRTLWNELDKGGVAMDMHLPPEDGSGRGAYGSRIVKPGEKEYAMAVEMELEKRTEFDVDKVPALGPAPPPPSIRLLRITRSGKPVGTLDFSTDPPALTTEPGNVDGTFLKGHWEGIAKQERVKVRYHQPRDGVETLITAEAKRGDANYPEVVRLSLILYHYYDEQRGYTLEAVP